MKTYIELTMLFLATLLFLLSVYTTHVGIVPTAAGVFLTAASAMLVGGIAYLLNDDK